MNNMKWIEAKEQVPEIWKLHGSASKRLNLKVQDFAATGRYLKDKDIFEIVDSEGHSTVFERESFHLIQWLDETPEPQPNTADAPIEGSLEQRAKEYLDKMAYNGSWDTDQMIEMFFAGASSSQHGGDAVAIDKDYNPIGCDHKLPNGFTAFMFLSESSGSGPDINYMEHISICTKCSELRICGHKDNHHFEVEFDLHYPEAVEAIIKYCNFMNAESEGYVPFGRIVSRPQSNPIPPGIVEIIKWIAGCPDPDDEETLMAYFNDMRDKCKNLIAQNPAHFEHLQKLHKLNPSLVDKLREANPWCEDKGAQNRNLLRSRVWNECCDTLASLISVGEKGERECDHPYAFIYRKVDYEKCQLCDKVLCEG